MTADGCATRALRRLDEAALWLRAPTRRLAGSVRVAVAVGAVLVGGFTALLGGLYFSHSYRYFEVHMMEQTTAGYSFVTVITDIVLVTAILMRDEHFLEYALSAAMAVYMVGMPLFCATSGAVLNNGFADLPVWEVPRLALYLLHLGLMQCLLVELRGEVPSDSSDPPPEETWFRNNLNRETASLTEPKAALRDDRPDAPAILERTTCSAVAPVHRNIAVL